MRLAEYSDQAGAGTQRMASISSDVDLVADEQPAVGQRRVGVKAEVTPVDLTCCREAGAGDAPRVGDEPLTSSSSSTDLVIPSRLGSPDTR